MQNYSENMKEIQETIIEIVGEWVSIEDAVEAYYHILDESPLY